MSPFDARKGGGRSATGATRARSTAGRRPATGPGARTRHGRLGGAGARRVAPAPQALRWKADLDAEVAVAAMITARCSDRVVALHDRRIPGTWATIDHLVVAPTGVWVIASDRCRGRAQVDEPMFGEATLEVGGRDRTELVDGLSRNVEAVATAMLQIDPWIPVSGALCLVTPKGVLAESGLPVIRALSVRGVPLLTPQRLVAKLLAEGSIEPLRRTRVARSLSQRFAARDR